MTTDSNDRARKFLEAAGYYCEEEPEWAKSPGRKVPDFYCTGRHEFWSEVKTIYPEENQKKLFKQAALISDQAKKINAQGRGDGWVSAEATDSDMKKALHLVKWLLENPDNSANYEIAIVPPKSQSGQYLEIKSSIQGETIRVAATASDSGRYGLMRRDKFISDDLAKLHYSSVKKEKRRAFDVFDVDSALVCIEVTRDDKPFRINSMGGNAWRSNFVERLRAAAGNANSQFKDALVYRDSPTLLIVDDPHLTPSDEHLFESAFYGDLAVTWNLNDNKTEGLRYSGNSIWQPRKNTTTSAACYLCKRELPIILHNFWAERPFPSGALPAIEKMPKKDGTWCIFDNT